MTKTKERRLYSFPIKGRQSIVCVYRVSSADFVARVLYPNGKSLCNGKLDRMVCLSYVSHAKHTQLNEVAYKVGKQLASELSKTSHMGKGGGK